MRFFFLRHGKKAEGEYYNPLLRHQDQPLSSQGRKQAAKLKKYFSRHPIRSVYVSEYLRTEQTARPLANRLKLDPIVDPRLNEIDNGIAEKLYPEELRELHPDVWRAYQSRECDFRWPEGETGREAQERIVGFVAEHADQDRDILVVAHDGIIRLLVCFVLGLPVYRRFSFQVDPASITEIEWDRAGGCWRLIRFNQSAL